MAFLAIDYGTSRVGLALSHHGFAEPVKTISLDAVFAELPELTRSQDIEAIVVGMPDGMLQPRISEFIQVLKKATSLTVFIVEETFSSKEVQQEMIESGATAHDRSQPIDHYVAAKLLQTFLDTHPSLRKEAV